MPESQPCAQHITNLLIIESLASRKGLVTMSIRGRMPEWYKDTSARIRNFRSDTRPYQGSECGGRATSSSVKLESTWLMAIRETWQRIKVNAGRALPWRTLTLIHNVNDS
jgi:hypothetical protein